MSRSARRRTAVRLSVVIALSATALAAGGLELVLRAGPTRPATFAGKRVAAGPAYRVSYTYDGGNERRSADTDVVSRDYFLRVRRGTPLRVRTIGVGTFRFARLAGGSTGTADALAAGRWGAVAAVVGVGVYRRRRWSPVGR